MKSAQLIKRFPLLHSPGNGAPAPRATLVVLASGAISGREYPSRAPPQSLRSRVARYPGAPAQRGIWRVAPVRALPPVCALPIWSTTARDHRSRPESAADEILPPARPHRPPYGAGASGRAEVGV